VQETSQVDFTGEFKELVFKVYPVIAKEFTIAIDYHAVGMVKGLMFIRVRSGNETIYESALSNIEIKGIGDGKDFGMITKINDITFPRQGLYMFDIVFDNVVLHSAPLTISVLKYTRKKHGSRK
jgi:hypothetical protein